MSRCKPVTFLAPITQAFCIEGGGTHTKAALFSDPEISPEIYTSGTCNPTTNFEVSVASVRDVWSQAQTYGDVDPANTRLVLGAAGLVPPNVRKAFIAEFAEFADVVAISDGYASMVGCGEGSSCGMVVAGTGCAGHRMRPDGTSFQRDGWGWIGGDRGSGAWIGQRAIRHSLQVRDGLKPSDILAERILPQLGEDNAQIAAWFKNCEPADIAHFTIDVAACAKEGDDFCEQLLLAAATELCLLFTSLECTDAEPLFMSGSICRLLEQRIQSQMKNKPTLMEGKALLGSAYVAFGKAPLEWPNQATI